MIEKISLNNSSIYGYLRPSNQTSNTLKNSII